MDNDFKRSQQRPMGRSFGQPIQPRPLQPRPQPMQRPMQSQPGMSAPQPMKPLQPRPVPYMQPQPTVSAPRPHVQQPNAQPLPEVHHDTTPPPQKNQQHTPPAKKKPGKGKKIAKIAFHIVLICMLIFGCFWYYTSTQKELDKNDQQITDLKQALKDSDNARSALSQTDSASAVVITQDDKNTITNAVSTGNYASIQEKIGDPVLIIVAATEGIGRRSAEQAVSDMNYLKSAKQPWNFNLSPEELAKFSSGQYAQYFPEGAIVGKSADNKVVSFSLTPSGKIGVIFMCGDASIL